MKTKTNTYKTKNNIDNWLKMNVSSHNIYVLGILSSCPGVMALYYLTGSVSGPLSPRQMILIVLFYFVLPQIFVWFLIVAYTHLSLLLKRLVSLWQDKHTSRTFPEKMHPSFVISCFQEEAQTNQEKRYKWFEINKQCSKT